MSYYESKQTNLPATLVTALQDANLLIFTENVISSQDADGKRAMGTTCLAAVLHEQNLLVANVGDSRAYIIHAGGMRQVSQDHSLVAQMVRNGEITAAEARVHAQRNIIYRSLGYAPEVEVDLFVEPVERGDAVLLCTDGLSGLVDDAEVLRIVEAYGPDESVQQLIAAANAAGGPDNITAIVVRVD